MHYRAVKHLVLSSGTYGKNVETFRSQLFLKPGFLPGTELSRKFRAWEKTDLSIFDHQRRGTGSLSGNYQDIDSRLSERKSRLPSETALSPQPRQRRNEAYFQASSSRNPGVRKRAGSEYQKIFLLQGVASGMPGIVQNTGGISRSAAVFTDILAKRLFLETLRRKIDPNLGSSVTPGLLHTAFSSLVLLLWKNLLS